MTDPKTPEIGPLVRQARQKKSMTLEQLAAASGVSRSMLSQIERGQANPTFATLWSLTHALGLELADLAGGGMSEVRHDAIDVMQDHFTPEIRTQDGRCTLRILSPADQVGELEWYEIIMGPGAELTSEPHAQGCHEHLTALEGAFEIKSGNAQVRIEKGATARYAAYVPHAIWNSGHDSARGLLVVQNPIPS